MHRGMVGSPYYFKVEHTPCFELLLQVTKVILISAAGNHVVLPVQSLWRQSCSPCIPGSAWIWPALPRTRPTLSTGQRTMFSSWTENTCAFATASWRSRRWSPPTPACTCAPPLATRASTLMSQVKDVKTEVFGVQLGRKCAASCLTDLVLLVSAENGENVLHDPYLGTLKTWKPRWL